jgi:hypothetical protein
MAEANEECVGAKVRIKVTEMGSRASEIFDLFEGGENFPCLLIREKK